MEIGFSKAIRLLSNYDFISKALMLFSMRMIIFYSVSCLNSLIDGPSVLIEFDPFIFSNSIVNRS